MRDAASLAMAAALVGAAAPAIAQDRADGSGPIFYSDPERCEPAR